MLRLTRLVMLVVLLFLIVGLVVGIARPETGPVEDIVLVGIVLGLFALAVPVGRIGAASS